MADEKNDDDERAEEGSRAAQGRRDVRVVGARPQGDLVHRQREVDGAPQEGEARGRDLLRGLRRDWRRPRTARHLRVQRRSRRVVRVPAHGSGRPAAGRLPRGRDAADRSRAARRERVVLARVHRPRLRRPRRHGVEPNHRAGEEGRRQGRRRQAGRRSRPEGVLRLQARPRVDVRVHGPLAVRERPLGLSRLHRGRELRRLSRRPARADAAGDDRDRAQRCDPHLPGARDHATRIRRTTTSSAGSTACPRWPQPRSITAAPGRSARAPRWRRSSATPRSSRPATTRRSSRGARRCPRRSARGSSGDSPTSSACPPT